MGSYQEAYFKEIFQVVEKLEINILDVPANIVSKVTNTIDATAKMGIKDR